MKYIVLFLLVVLYLFQFKTGNCQISNDNSKKVFTIILDAGHGGKDPGTIGLSGVYEKNIVLPIVLKIKDLLNSYHNQLKVVLTRSTDEFIELKERGKIANSNNGDLFVSVHCNYKKTEENDKNGFEIYISDLVKTKDAENYTINENLKYKPYNSDSLSKEYINFKSVFIPMLQNAYFRKSEYMAGILRTEFTKSTNLQSRGIFQDAFFVLIGASMPSLLIECGFLSNKSDEEYLKSEKGQTDIAKAIYKSIVYYKMDFEFENLFGGK